MSRYRSRSSAESTIEHMQHVKTQSRSFHLAQPYEFRIICKPMRLCKIDSLTICRQGSMSDRHLKRPSPCSDTFQLPTTMRLQLVVAKAAKRYISDRHGGQPILLCRVQMLHLLLRVSRIAPETRRARMIGMCQNSHVNRQYTLTCSDCCSGVIIAAVPAKLHMYLVDQESLHDVVSSVALERLSSIGCRRCTLRSVPCGVVAILKGLLPDSFHGRQ